MRPACLPWASSGRCQGHETAAVRLTLTDSSHEGSPQCVGVCYLEESVKGHGDQRHRFGRALLLEGKLPLVVDDQLVVVAFRQVLVLGRLLYDFEAARLLALQQTLQ